MSDYRPRYSIIAPVFNEEDGLAEFHRRTAAVQDSLDGPSELLLVFDGSQDRSPEIGAEIAARDPRVKLIRLSRNFGHQIAITAGLDYAEGDAVIIIDSDLQDPPEVIPAMIARWREGFDVVYAQRERREGETFFKLFTASVFYRLIRRLASIDIPPDTGDFRLVDRKVVLAMRRLREQHRFMRGLAVWVGYRQTGVRYVRNERFAGETQYPLRKMIRFAGDAITGFSYVPLQLATTVGFWVSGLALVAIPVVAVLRLMGSNFFFGQATTLLAVLFLGGVQLISLGIIGEYLGRIYDEVKNRPLYLTQQAPPPPTSSAGSHLDEERPAWRLTEDEAPVREKR
jgi:polyisoprenyl-phosphate glycosyltransferase